MVFKSYSASDVHFDYRPSRRVEGNLIGCSNEKVYRLDAVAESLVRLNSRQHLVSAPENDRAFDVYAGLPFTKGMTERETGRTLVVLEPGVHHGQAMIGQFDCTLWEPERSRVSYGNTIRWLSVGGLADGFVGIEYKPRAVAQQGIARTLTDIGFVAKQLIGFGMNERKKMYVLTPPHIVESPFGQLMRAEGLEALGDYSRL